MEEKNKMVHRIIVLCLKNQLSKTPMHAGNYKASFKPEETLIIKKHNH
jgi:hypothetical protein